ncbi:MAG: peptidoglycan-binding protein [Lentisphaerota bacterium]
MKLTAMHSTVLCVIAACAFSGCATARPKPANPADLERQVATLQNEVQTKDQQIQDLQYQIESSQQAIKPNFANKSSGRSSIIKVSGVTVADVQRALVRQGFNPGPIDGQLGLKTKKAIKAFQRKHGLHADGVIGDKTWAYLQS